MKIEMLCENKVKLMHEAEDLSYYGLTFEEIDYERPATQRAFRDMMSRVRRDVGFSSEGCRLLVEARPAEGGGCILVVTKQPLQRKSRSSVRKPGEGKSIFRFEHTDDLLDALTGLRRFREEETRLYRMEGSYYASVKNDGNAARLLREFARECPSRTEGLLEQKGAPIAL